MAEASALLPGALVVYLSFNAGGYFPNTQGLVAIGFLLALAGWIAIAPEPFAGLSWYLVAAASALTAYALWTLLSASWSESLARALIEFNRGLVYIGALLFFGLVVRRPRQLQRLVWGLAIGITIVCGAALMTRLLPDAWSVKPDLGTNRLSFPLTYWNTLGLLAVIGIIFALHMTTRGRGPRWSRVFGAAAIPLLVTTVYFTFSRGAILVGVVGVVTYLVFARPRGTITGLLASLPPAALILVVAYNSDLLATRFTITDAATSQGHNVAWALCACVVGAGVVRVALLGLDARLARVPQDLVPRRAALVGVGAILVAGTGVALALGAPGWLKGEYNRLGDNSVNAGNDIRTRLTDPGANGRFPLWRIAIREFDQAKLRGGGAGTFELAWDRWRPTADDVKNAHSLYLETLGELGVVGLLSLLTTLGAILWAILRRMRAGHRPLYAAVLAATLAWIMGAGVDWHWQMPAVTVWLFAAGGAVAASATRRPSLVGTPPMPVRFALAIPLILLAALPYAIYSSQAWLDRANAAFEHGNCPAASRDARSSISSLGSRPEPFELLGYCAIRGDRPRQAIRDLNNAIDRDPENWSFHYGLGLARGSAGLDPRRQLRRAYELNPREFLTKGAVRRFGNVPPRRWPSLARDLANRLTNL